MAKKELKPSTFLAPLPAVLVACRDRGGRANLLTVAWTGIICSDPPLLSISVRPSRYSHSIIKETGEFTVNLPPATLVRQTDLCGVLSGRSSDKFAEVGLTAVPAAKVSAPLVKECLVNLECKVTEMVPLGVHDMFLAEILATHVDEEALDAKGRIKVEIVNPLAYCPLDHSYRALGDPIGTYGYSKK